MVLSTCPTTFRSVVCYLEINNVRAARRRTENIRDRAIRKLWKFVADATLESEKPPEERDEKVALRLHPKTAVWSAIDAIAKRDFGSALGRSRG